VHDAETALAAALAGLGKTFLPRAIAENEPALQPVAAEPAHDDLSRELWLLGHADQLSLPRIAAVVRWLETLVQTSA
jgi:DNA-binding transcriptional LysR family regulator